MSFVMGSSCFPITSQSFLLSSTHVTNAKNHITSVITASHRHESSNEDDFCRRRAIVALGISALPFLQLNSRAAAQSLAKVDQDTRMLKENPSTEQLHQGEAPPNALLSLLNVVGILGSGVLGALYTLAQKEKTTTETTVEYLRNRLIEKDVAMLSLEKNLEKRLLNEQEERARQNKKAKEEQGSISNQLAKANSTIAGLGKEFQNEKKVVEELRTYIDELQNQLTKAGEVNKMFEAKLKEKLDSIEGLENKINLLTLEIRDKEDKLQNISSLLKEKVSECDDLIFINRRGKEDLTEANSQIKSLKEELLMSRKDLDSKISAVDNLNRRISTLTTEREDINRKHETLQEDYNNLSSSSKMKAASDAELLGKSKHELHQLEGKFTLALDDLTSNQKSIADLTLERDGLRNLLEVEVNNVKNLRHELKITQETLQISRNEVTDLSEQLKKSRTTCQELASETSRVQIEFDEVRDLLVRSLDEARSNSKALSVELASVGSDLQKTKEELQTASDELASVTEIRESLKKELLDVYKKAQSASHELKEERNVVATLHKQLEASEKQIMEDREARKSVETDLEEATKSLDEVSKNLLLVSRELDIANSRVENLEVEKDMLYKSLTEQKNLSKEARENIEDEHDVIMKLGKEREIFRKRGKKLEEELTSAKGEILQLRSQRSASKSSVKDEKKKKSTTEVENDVVVPVKKVGRRKRAVFLQKTPLMRPKFLSHRKYNYMYCLHHCLPSFSQVWPF